jgi:hypothetical protein
MTIRFLVSAVALVARRRRRERPIPATIKLVDALVKANKDFDFLIMPNRPHGFGNDPYFVRRRWDYFVKNLLGVEPPTGFNISRPRTTSTSQADNLK